jgi:hypothetical protein
MQLSSCKVLRKSAIIKFVAANKQETFSPNSVLVHTYHIHFSICIQTFYIGREILYKLVGSVVAKNK